MKLRGPGDMEGTQQSGIAFNLRVADLARDGQILTRAREAALSILRGNPSLLAQGTSPSPPQPGDLPPMSVSEREVALIRNELQVRFAHSVDWSLIS